ncbi:hypothetical protein, unlikely [Trypanosoma brucei gambiense DAL972]|uniref:Uncharacterized protein n=1 Tax=Trypanosoma brucei gambiense (strain MHOM/CI/86/DAL972) TaxID=679716 RepID=C9ZST2_TRYB9|nr:hypothetical protein, unlikely [Trypanosoma brucei gambiense DAL972]CBH12467.1 hypothetical protein, unlikely [Trypanosoma brucei gambiense DAL972]|eukprot:XP_011774747.1 hypothetical protein, unlikely [Trypanosoma brucei gambiense DAL972]
MHVLYWGDSAPNSSVLEVGTTGLFGDIISSLFCSCTKGVCLPPLCRLFFPVFFSSSLSPAPAPYLFPSFILFFLRFPFSLHPFAAVRFATVRCNRYTVVQLPIFPPQTLVEAFNNSK